ncbi:copine family protein [Rhynchospora pubera]|uniref:Copine family protein n=1 Tax=Rhynchospora pubera TaxID=906938 RepID=A0AAV8DYX5_9POAL|nr:copine family protein [Rhynchospora pubera]KAJ4779691.1 copine family protein [Rhynchospora pubera]KAJ4786628.1 copine family protein [Rhynchospora pubera]
MKRRYSLIQDSYDSMEQVTTELAKAGLESSNLIIGIDFTKSNEWTGKNSFDGLSLHNIGDFLNPYEKAITIIGETMSKFDDDNLIPCFGFGDSSTHDRDVFSFYHDQRPCIGTAEALKRYRELVPHIRLAGPTSFAPIIEMAMTVVESTGGQYHVLLIIADGQITRSADTTNGQLSPQERMTINAIVKASEFPLSIVLVGVGDGPWDMMKKFDDNIPARSFDNFQFVNFTEIMSKRITQPVKEAEFALAALMEVPSQYKAIMELGILGRQIGRCPMRVPLPPPAGNLDATIPNTSQFLKQHTVQQKRSQSVTSGTPPTGSSSSTTPTPGSDDQQLCPICLVNPKDMAFGCGHQTCCNCGKSLQNCPICRSAIETRIKLY